MSQRGGCSCVSTEGDFLMFWVEVNELIIMIIIIYFFLEARGGIEFASMKSRFIY